MKNPSIILEEQGIVPYEVALIQQREYVASRLNNPDLCDVLMLLEHPPVYTLGTGASWEYVKLSPQDTLEVHRVERGGEVTHHYPGQLVIYPILNLRYYRQDLHWYLRQLEQVVIELIALYGLKGERIAGLTGVWLNGHKVAAIGIKVRSWITMHGLALNVGGELGGFNKIVPCGIADKPVGSLIEFIPEIQLKEVRRQIVECFCRVFEVQLCYPSSHKE